MGERGHVTLQKPREFPLFQRGSPDPRGSRGIPVKAMKTNVLPRERQLIEIARATGNAAQEYVREL